MYLRTLLDSESTTHTTKLNLYILSISVLFENDEGSKSTSINRTILRFTETSEQCQTKKNLRKEEDTKKTKEND